MDNVYNIRLEKNLFFVLPDSVRNNIHTVIKRGEMAVIIHFYYEDTVDKYFDYICRIPSDIDVFISVSEEKTKFKIENQIKKHNLNNCRIVKKQNRGRDISALLVACREIAMKYEYICFLHDKKANGERRKQFTEEWISLMWENMIASEELIYNIRDVFDTNQNIGILAVPEPFGKKDNCAFENSWYANFDETLRLADRLGIQCNLDEKFPPITIGTAFWAKTKALQKLLSYPWSYEDFMDEPLPDDGTLNHAVERIFAYAAQDAGYDTGTIRTTGWAEKHIGIMQHLLRIAFHNMEDLVIRNIDDMVNYRVRQKKCFSFFEKYEEVYLYGAGKWGRGGLKFLRTIGLQPKAFIVTFNVSGSAKLEGIPIKELEQINLTEKTGIIITAGADHKNEIIEVLERKGFHDYMWMLEEG